mmetsp:Transcript_17232/g.42877  ORF Transcript_17232/g.42877 Transcript_17232/m.42877 type:complete len:582 (+) Transcript_17232:211-1956(+)
MPSYSSGRPRARAARPREPAIGPALRAGRRAGLASAARLLGALARALGRGQGGELLGGGGVDADGVVEVGLGRAQLHAESEALRDLARVGAADVQAEHAHVLADVAHELRVARVVAAVRHRPLERLVVGVEDLDVGLTVGLDGHLLGKAARAVLEGRVHGGGHERVVHRGGALAVQPRGEQLARLDGDGGELGGVGRRLELSAVDDVADRVDVRHVGLLVLRGDLVVGVDLHARRLEAHARGARVAPHGEHDRVELVRGGGAVLERPGHLLASRVELLHRSGHGALDELGAVLRHVVLHLSGHLLVEAAQRDGAHHDGRVEAHPVDEAGTLECDVRCAHDERLAGRRLEAEDVVGGDAVLLGSRDVGVAGPAARRDDEGVRGDARLLALLVDRDHRLLVDESSEGVVVLDRVGHEVGSVAEVERLDVHHHVAHHRLPVVLRLGHLPPVRGRVLDALAEQSRLVHQLLGDAPDVDAGAAQAPGRALGRRLDEVADRDLLAILGSRLGASEAARASSNHQEIVVHCFRGHLSRGAELGAEAGAVPRCDRGNARSSECGSEDEPANEQNVEPRRFRASRSPRSR